MAVHRDTHGAAVPVSPVFRHVPGDSFSSVFSRYARFRVNRDSSNGSVRILLDYPDKVPGRGDNPWLDRELGLLSSYWNELYSDIMVTGERCWDDDYAYAVRTALEHAYANNDHDETGNHGMVPMRLFSRLCLLIVHYGPSIMKIPPECLFREVPLYTVLRIADMTGCKSYYQYDEDTGEPMDYRCPDLASDGENECLFDVPVFDAGFIDLMVSCDNGSTPELYDLFNYYDHNYDPMVPWTRTIRGASIPDDIDRGTMMYALRVHGKSAVLTINALKQYIKDTPPPTGTRYTAVNIDRAWIDESVSTPYTVFRENLYNGDYDAMLTIPAPDEHGQRSQCGQCAHTVGTGDHVDNARTCIPVRM